MNEAVERPYRPSVGDQIWERSLRNHLPKPLRDETMKQKDLLPRMSGGPLSPAYMLVMHEAIQLATAHLYEQNAEITAAAIADVLKTKTFSLHETSIRKYLQDNFAHLIDYYGISVETLRENNKQYKQAIVSLWNKHHRKPTQGEIGESLHLSHNSVSSKLTRNPWLKKLWEQGPKPSMGGSSEET